MNNDSVRDSQRIEQLADLLSLIEQQVQGNSSKNALALVHVLPNTSIESWQKTCVQHKLCEKFFPIPLDPAIASTTQYYTDLFSKLTVDSTVDALTNIFNRRYFEKALAAEFERSVATQDDLSLIIFDIDNFKRVNDSYGHPCGDIVLQKLAATIKKNCRTYDIPARVGGEEFALLLPSSTLWEARKLGQQILRVFSQISFFYADQSFSVTFSAGIASLAQLDTSRSPSRLFQVADDALYLAKNSGKNQIIFSQAKLMNQQTQTLVREDEKKLLFSFNGVK